MFQPGLKVTSQINACKLLERAVTPQVSVENIICILQRCRKIKNLKTARQVHARICNNKLDDHETLGNYIVPMFVECGSMFDAQQLFDKFANQNEYSWTSLIVGHIGLKQPERALGIYERMRKESIHPSSFTLISLLRACAQLKDVESGRQLHLEIKKYGFESDLWVGNTLIHMYAKCGLLAEAWGAFGKLKVRDVVSWTAIIAAYAENGQHQEALCCFKKMQLEDVSPNSVTFVCTLNACGNLGAIVIGREVHAVIALREYLQDLFVGNSLISMYVKCGSVNDAQEVFDKLPVRDLVSWTALVAGYADNGLGNRALKLFDQMKYEGISPNAATFLCSLKACISIGAIQKGRRLHAEIVQKGFEADLSVSNGLVDLYAKCGSMIDAQELFDKLEVHDMVCWTMLIAGYAEDGFYKEALYCFEQMQVEGLSPDGPTFVCCLNACNDVIAIERGREIHAQIIERRFEWDSFICNSLIHMYTKFGLLADAQNVFDRLPSRDVVSWTAMITGYVENGIGHQVLNCLDQMQLERIAPNAITFASLLKACRSMVNMGRELHCQIIQKGFQRDASHGKALIEMYIKCGSVVEAEEVFDRLPVRNVVIWNTLISGYTGNGFDIAALKCLSQMQLENVLPNASSFIFCLKSCGNIGAIANGRKVHLDIVQAGLERDLLVNNTLISMYMKCHSIEEAKKAFGHLLIRDVVSWNALLKGYAENGQDTEILKCYQQMILEGIEPNTVTYAYGLRACGRIGAIDKGRQVHAAVMDQRLEKDVLVGTSLVYMYSKCGMLEEAKEAFEKMPVQDVITWTMLIGGYAEIECGEEALRCFDQMQLDGVSPNAITYICSLKACGKIQAIDKGREIHVAVAQSGYGDLFVGNSLVDMYARCGSFTEAREVFDKLPIRNVVSWTTLIGAYAELGDGQDALNCFEEMQMTGMAPNPVTFLCCLKACARLHNIDMGREIHMELVQRGFEQIEFVANCLIDMYVKCGSLVEAQMVFDKLQIQDIVSWNTLITGYSENGENLKAIECFEQMQLKGITRDATTFVCILKCCGNLGFLDKGQEIHIEISREGIEKDLIVGNALIDMYVKCSALTEARLVFDKLPCRDVVSWTAMIRGYGMNHECDMALNCFKIMQEQNVEADAITFTCLLTACSRAGLLKEGQAYFKMMENEYGIRPTGDHYNCIVDLLARSGHLHEATNLLETAKCSLSKETWIALLSACKTFEEENLGLRYFEQLHQQNPEHAASYVLMTSIYASTCQGRLE